MHRRFATSIQRRADPGGRGGQRICHVNLAKDYRGGERQTELLIRALAARGWPQRLVARTGAGLAARVDGVDNLEVIRSSSSMLAAARAARNTALVHAHEARAVYAGWYAAKRYGIPFVLTRRMARRLKTSFMRDRAYRKAAAVVGISAAACSHVREAYPDLDPLVIPDAHAALPVDAEFSTTLRERYLGQTLIGHVGTYDHSVKGQLTIIEAARRAADERPDWRFFLLGAGKDEVRFREAIGELDNIELVGFVDNVGDYLAAFDVFVFPSLHEALGSSVLDAMSFGLPVVATRVGGIPEFVEDGKNGFLIDTESPGQLFDGIAKIVDDEERAGAMHLANRARAAEYGAGEMATAYEALYERILA